MAGQGGRHPTWCRALSTSWWATPKAAYRHTIQLRPLARCSVSGRRSAPRGYRVYGNDRGSVLGIFDVEASYDVTRLQTELLAANQLRHPVVTFANGRLCAVDVRQPRRTPLTLDQRGSLIARQFAPDGDQHRQRASAAASDTRSPVSPRCRARLAGVGIQINRYGGNSTMLNSGNIANSAAPKPLISSLTYTPARGGGRAVRHRAVRLRDRPHRAKRRVGSRRADQRAGTKGSGPQPAGRAEPGKAAIGRYRQLLAGAANFRYRCPARWARYDRIQALLVLGLAFRRRPC